MGKKGQSVNSIQLKQARLTAIRRMPPVAEKQLMEKGRELKVFTFRWDDKEVSPLVLRLLQDGECPQFTGPLRAYVDCTAKGLKPSSMLGQELDKFSGIDQTDAFKEGIRRWHTFSPSQGKERL